MTRDRGGPLMGALLAVLVVASLLPAGAAVQTGNQSETVQQLDSDDDELEKPDEIFVRENGDAILVYNEQDASADSQSKVRVGADVSSSLMYMLVTEPREGPGSGTGQASLALTPTKFVGNGSLSVNQPRLLEDFSMELSGQSTDQNADGTLTLDATATVPGRSAQQFNSMTTEGEIEVTASQFTGSGSLDTDLQRGNPVSSSGTGSASFSLTESDGSYTVEVEENRTVSSFSTSDWETREAARETLEEQYQPNADELDGSAEITIKEYSFKNVSSSQSSTGFSTDQSRLDISYTVKYTDIESELADAIAQDMAEDPDFDPTQEQIDAFSEGLEKLSVNRVSGSYAADSTSVTANFDVDIENYDEALLGIIEISQAASTEELDAASLQGTERLRKQLDAQSAAGLTQTYTWSGDVSKPTAGAIALDFDANYETENWGAYVSELESRGIDTASTEYKFTGSADGDQLNFDGRMTVEGDLVQGTIDQLANSTEDDDPSTQQILTALRQSNLEIARMNANLNESDFTLEANARFENLSALRDALAASEEDVPAGVTSLFATRDSGSDTTKTYVTVKGAVGSGASESDIRKLEYVSDDTTVHPAGSWDRKFPVLKTKDGNGGPLGSGITMGTDDSMNMGDNEMDGGTSGTEASGTETSGTETSGTETSSGSGPGFGAGLAILALLSSAFLAARRQ